MSQKSEGRNSASVQFKVVSKRWEKPICATPSLSAGAECRDSPQPDLALTCTNRCFWPFCLSSVQFKMIFVRSEKPICALPRPSRLSARAECRDSPQPHPFALTCVSRCLRPIRHGLVQDAIYALGKAHMRFTPLSQSQITHKIRSYLRQSVSPALPLQPEQQQQGQSRKRKQSPAQL